MARMLNFAWVDASETTFDPVDHAREDERVYSYEFEHVEGDFASLKITIKNPRVGLLALGRKTWLWFSKLHEGVQTPLFFGRLIGIPDNIFQDTIELEFTARPADYADQKVALADTLKVAPYWDPLFVKEDSLDDPDVVLEARTALWHIDPVTHVVTISDILVGEDGTVTFTGDDYYDGDMELSRANTPARSAVVRTSVSWDNQGAGTIDLTGLILETWRNPVGNYWGMISSYTFPGLLNDWPQDQKSLGKGYYVYQSYLRDVTNENVPPYIKKDTTVADDFEFPSNLPVGSLMLAGPAIIGQFGFNPEPLPSSMTYVPLGWGVPKFVLGYAASRSYTENLTITMTCAVQDVLTLSGEDDVITIDVPANSASAVLLGEIPIGDVGRRSYVLSDRGLDRSLPHLVAIGRANLISRSRAFRLTFTTNFSNMLPCSLRKSAVVYNLRLPGGQMVGKIVGIQHGLDGATGALRAKITIASCAGLGGAPYTVEPGDPTYVEEGYVAQGYQRYDSSVMVLPSSDVSFSVESFEPDDDGVDFTSRLGTRDVIRLFTISGQPDDQAESVMDGSVTVTPATYGVQGSTSYDEAKIRQLLQESPSKVNMELRPLATGPFETDVSVTVTDLIIPRQIDLEAEAAS